MTATGDGEEMDSLLSTFDHIHQDYKNAIYEIQTLKSNFNAEIKKREALQFTCDGVKMDNERLRKIYTGSLNKVADQLELRTECHSLKEELKRMKAESFGKEDECRRAMAFLKEDHAAKVRDLENHLRGAQLQITENEAATNQLHQDLTAYKNHVEALACRMEHDHLVLESQYHHEIQDLKDCLLVEQEEKNELNKKLQGLEKELLISRTKLTEQQQGSTSNRHVETLKQKIMKLRKENEILRRQLLGKDG